MRADPDSLGLANTRHSDFTIGPSLLTQGGQSCVYEAHLDGNPGKLALKVLWPLTANPQKRVQMIEHEVEMNSIISNIDCPYVLRPVEMRPCVVRGCSTHLMFMPYYADGDLITEVMRTPDGLSEPAIRHYGRQMLLAVQALHSSHIVHADVKPDNFCLKRSASGAGEIALCDFGMSQVLDDDGLFARRGDIGTKLFLPPEFFRHDVTRVGKPMDLWALGVTFYVMAIGEYPFNLTFIQAPLDHDPPLTFDPPFPSLTTDDLTEASNHFVDLIQGLLQVDPDRRLVVEQALDHRFFKAPLEGMSVKAAARRICLPGDELPFSDDSGMT